MKIPVGSSHIDIPTPCDFRAEIYKDYLLEVCLTLTGRGKAVRLLLGQPQLPEPVVSLLDDGRVRKALWDHELYASLAKILDKYVINGVAEDLAKWRKEAYDRWNSRPKPPATPPTEPITVDFLDTGKEWTPDKIRDKNETELKCAYEDYFKLYIARQDMPGLQAKHHNETMSGVEAFFRRYPLIRHAVATSAANFRDNILLACQRILTDWESIGKVFFPGDVPTDLTKIKSSGSDTHKGGKQVLFLTFQLSKGQLGQLVYKPSDVEIDYLLVGNTHTTLNQYGLGPLQSLTELINTATKNSIGLPTYRILPRSPGSKLTEDPTTHILPVYDSYGYIEFLTHEPPADENGRPKSIRRGSRDWVTDNPEDVEKFYRQLGGFMAIISVFSLCDFHHENIIVHNRQPYLIDLENCFAKPISGFDSVLGDGLLRFDVLDKDNPKIPNEGNVNLQPPGEWNKKSTHNRIWLNNDRANPAGYIQQISDGFFYVLKILKDQGTSFQDWLDQTKLCVARSVILPTSEYYNRKDTIYMDVTRDPTSIDPEGKENLDSSKQYERWNEQAKSAFRDGENVVSMYKVWPPPAPIYALQTWKNDFSDYFNCDIPAYYHRLDSKDLINARGEKVNIRLNMNMDPDPGRDEYFPQSTWEIVYSQLQELGTPGKYIQRIAKCTRQIKQWLTFPHSHSRESER